MVGAIGSSLGAIDNAMKSTETIAKKVAQQGGGDDPVGTTVGLMENKRQVEVSVKTIQTADEMIGSVLNLKA